MQPIRISFFSFVFLFLLFCALMLKIGFPFILVPQNFAVSNKNRIFVVSKGKNIKYFFWRRSLDVDCILLPFCKPERKSVGKCFPFQVFSVNGKRFQYITFKNSIL